MVRQIFFALSAVSLVTIFGLAWVWPPALWALAIAGPIVALGMQDALQRRRTILRNFPILGRFRYLLEEIRPEIQQYFVENNTDGRPIERELRSVVYQRAKGQLETVPFGTQRDVYRVGYEWASHSLSPRDTPSTTPRVVIGGGDCSQPYPASPLNISAMSYGALSDRAILALNRGAKAQQFAHNTGEGGVSRYHLEPGGDLIWQIGTGYFGCRTKDGLFDPERFREQASHPHVKMIEIKLSQGAKPGHGGILPGQKVNEEVARARGVEIGQTVISPPGHTAFSTPTGLIEFVAKLRELSGGKPVGFKLCVGRRTDFFSLCKAMREVGTSPDFISVDGGEGGTGAAPLEFSNSLGLPGRDAIVFVHNALTGANLRRNVKIMASGKIITSFHMVRAMALGADLCSSARGMMLALGCIQALRCNNNKCPTGIATQDRSLIYGLDVDDKANRVARFHHGTMHAFLELLGAMGLSSPEQIEPYHVFRRVDDLRIRNFAELYDFLEPGQLLEEDGVPQGLLADWKAATADRWRHQEESGRMRKAVSIPAPR